MTSVRRLILLLVGLAVLIGCDQTSTSTDHPILKKEIDQLSDEDIAKIVAVVKTNYGSFTIQLRPDWGPRACRHFIKQVREGLYLGQPISEIRPLYWVLIGDPDEKPGVLGNQFELEEGKGKHLAYSVGIYHPDYQPEMGGSRFYVMTVPRPELDKGYSVFGRVIKGQATIDRLNLIDVTCKYCQPKPYAPLKPVKVEDVSLEVLNP